MDFIKFFSLVRTGKLYFPSAWQLRSQDPFEGSLNAFHSKFQGVGIVGGGQDKTWFTERDVAPEGWDQKTWEFVNTVQSEQRREMRKYIYINSWHMSQHESFAMWKLYDISGNGLAIVSTFERLCKSLSYDRSIYIGSVKYIDYQSDDEWLGGVFDPFMRKSITLSHEREVRAMVWDHHDNFSDFLESLMRKRERLLPDPPTGISIDCDVRSLIDRVVVSPSAAQWVIELVTDYCKETLGKEASPSVLISEPFF